MKNMFKKAAQPDNYDISPERLAYLREISSRALETVLDPNYVPKQLSPERKQYIRDIASEAMRVTLDRTPD